MNQRGTTKAGNKAQAPVKVEEFLKKDDVDPVERKIRKLQQDQKKAVLQAISKLPMKGAVELRREFGILIPLRILAKEGSERRWAYMCKRCGHQALEFIGLQFVYQSGEGWAFSDQPPLGVPIDEIPWVQDHPKASRHGKDPFNIRCQFCGAEVILNPDRTLVPKRIVTIESIEDYWNRREKKEKDRSKFWRGTQG